MSTDREHLNEDQLVWSTVDDAALPAALRDHLSTCPQCRANKNKLEKDLARLGQMAQRLAPSPRKLSPRPLAKPHGSREWLWGWRANVGAALAAALVLIVLWWYPRIRTTPGRNASMVAQDMQEAEQLMTEVGMLVENALPPSYQEITGELSLDLDEEFIELIVPSVDAKPLTYESTERGALLC